MKDILHMIESLKAGAHDPNGLSALNGLGFISCANAVHIKHVPFYEPCIILVLSGRKMFFHAGKSITCDTGHVLTVPAPASFDLKNEPDTRSKQYRALIIPFAHDLLERLEQAHNMAADGRPRETRILKFVPEDGLIASIKHYLTSLSDARLRAHRLMEILLVLVNKNPELLAYAVHRKSWSQRVRAIVAMDLAEPWGINDVCQRLATTESTLRRHLKQEKTGFRELIFEMRLTTALMQLLQTSLPIYQIAYNCGYQSVSRFSSNFHKRFGLAPRAFRESMDEVEQTLTVSEHSRP